MSKIKPCIKYEDELDVTAMELAKVEVMVGGVSRSKKLPVFSASQGVEGLFHVIDKYTKAANRLAFSVADQWDLFEEVLDSVAEQKWHNLIQGITNPQRTAARFQRAQRESVALYAENEQPRDILIRCIQSDECRKPRKVDPGTHASRVESLCRFANRLDGTETALTEAQIKKYVFESFPVKWQNDYRKSHHDLADDTIANIVGYMNLCKGIADEDDDKRGKKRKASKEERIRGGGNQDTKTNNKKKRVDDNAICPVHGGHKWGVCSLNPRSELYRTGGRGRGRSGRFGGRGYGGRNYGGGRGYDQGGRGSYGGQGDYGGRGNHAGRFNGRGNQGGRGNGYHSYNEQHYFRGEEQPSTQQDWTQSEHYQYGPEQSGGWQAGSDSTGRGSSSRSSNQW